MTEPQSPSPEEVQHLRERIAQLESEVGELAEAALLLQQQEARLRQVIDLVPDLIFANDAEGRWLLANKALAEAMDTTVERIQGTHRLETAVDAEQAERLLADDREVLRSGEPMLVPEETMTDAHGEERAFQIRRIPYVDKLSGERAVLGVATDITERKRMEDLVVSSRDAVIFAMAKLAESRDNETGQHLERICAYTEILAREIASENDELDETWVDTITRTSVLHDIGKVGVPDAVLQKPGRLTEDEHTIIKKHTYIGGDTLLALKRRWGDDPFLVTAAQIAMSHHEKWDGSGYPFGLAGDVIPLTARIVAVADVYDALTSVRVYKKSMTHEAAADIIFESSGQHFDPAVVEAFRAVQEQFREIADRYRDAPAPPPAPPGQDALPPT